MVSLYPYQRRVRDLLRQGRSVLLHAPTGSGKTLCALYPFLEAWEEGDPRFPPRCVYSVPLRVLATQFLKEVRAWRARQGLARLPSLGIQTGDQPDDPEFRSALLFATVDQTLSAFLGVPYALPVRRANLNAGALVGAYLVWDEAHLLPRPMLQTALVALKALQGLSPFLWMTATLSRPMREGLAALTGAEVVGVSREEALEIETQGGAHLPRRRTLAVAEEPLSASAVREGLAPRTVVVCNTVERAQALFRELLALGFRPLPLEAPEVQGVLQGGEGPLEERVAAAMDRLYRLVAAQRGPWVLLLHSRFTRAHRALKEELVRREFGQDRGARRLDTLVLVATQVVEVGLNITAERMHTELAPVASLVQRAGRCARFPGEEGEIWVYPLPGDGTETAPYSRKECEATWNALREAGRLCLDFPTEQDLVDRVHGPEDQEVLAAIGATGTSWEKEVRRAIAFTAVEERRRLLRDEDSCTVLVHPRPEDLGNPFACEGFSLHRGTLRAQVEALLEGARARGLPWALARPAEVEEEAESGEAVRYRWEPVKDRQEVVGPLFAVPPALARYDPQEGFRLDPHGGGGDYTTPPAPQVARGEMQGLPYRRESYEEHIGALARALSRFSEKPALDYALTQLAAVLQVEAATLQRALAVTLAFHDAGKLTRRWQGWARHYHAAIGEAVPPGLLLAHTRYDPTNPVHQAVQRSAGRRPPHAAEGALAVSPAVWRLLGHEGLTRAVLTAIARHHSPHADQADAYQLEQGALSALQGALSLMAVATNDPPQRMLRVLTREDLKWESQGPCSLARWLVRSGEDWPVWLAYFVLVRALRLLEREAVAGQGADPSQGR